jgi:hypothetical protein
VTSVVNVAVQTYQPHRTENVDIKRRLPFFWRRVGNLLHRVQRAMIHNERVQPAPAIICELDGFGSETEVGEVTSQDLDAIGAVLIVQLVQRRMRA